MTIFLMVLPLLYIKTDLKIPLISILPKIFQKSSTTPDLSPLNQPIDSSSDKVRTQIKVEDLPVSVIGNFIYYEWDVLNGSGRLTWSGTDLSPLNIKITSTEEGFDLYMVFTFESLEWGTSLTYLGYAVPI